MIDPAQSQKPAAKPEAGSLFIVSAPSGAGKSTLCRAACSRFPALNYSISFTTREPRSGEQNGVDYFFISQAEFEKKIRQNEWAEWASVYGHYYGTSAKLLSQYLEQGRPVLLDIDVAGTMQILKRFPDSVTIFIMPPSLAALEDRLRQRGTDDTETLQKRLRHAQQEIDRKTMYRYVIVNDRLDEAIDAFCAIIAKHAPVVLESEGTIRE